MVFKEGNVTVMVGNLGRAIVFYTETLGLTLRYRIADKWAVLQIPGLTIGLHAAVPGHAEPGAAGGLSIGFHVQDLEAAMEALKRRGVEFTAVHQDEDARLAFFTDPDKNPLYLAQPAVSI
jgi:catechol 2,3-dioxygenase-like lactoylglutathione lyase family enzyme